MEGSGGIHIQHYLWVVFAARLIFSTFQLPGFCFLKVHGPWIGVYLRVLPLLETWWIDTQNDAIFHCPSFLITSLHIQSFRNWGSVWLESPKNMPSKHRNRLRKYDKMSIVLSMFVTFYGCFTLPETNIGPKHRPSYKDMSYSSHWFSGINSLLVSGFGYKVGFPGSSCKWDEITRIGRVISLLTYGSSQLLEKN